MEKKRKHIVVYWLFMIVLFVVILLSQQIVASIMQGSLSTSKFGHEATFEILWAGLVLIIVLLFKNKYIFTQDRMGFLESIPFVLPELLLSLFFSLLSIILLISNTGTFDIFAVFNLALYCLFIGIVEEFLCRGWLLNEFLERYSKNRKEIILSIIFSSFIFGVIHFINIGETRGIFETLVQVMNATAGGIFLALVYYKTKNIWVVVGTHALWDFSLFLGQANSLGDCLASTPTTGSVILNIVRGIVLTFAYLMFCYWLYRQTDLYEKEDKRPKDILIGIGVLVYIIGLVFVHGGADDSLCPDYTKKSIEDSFKVSYYHYDQYALENTPLVLDKDPENGSLRLNNTYTDIHSPLTTDDKFRDYLLIDNQNYYVLLIQTSSNVIYYGKYPKSELKDDTAYLKKVRDGLVKMAVPNIVKLGVIEIEGDDYQYPMLEDEIGQYYYFDSKGKLYIH